MQLASRHHLLKLLSMRMTRPFSVTQGTPYASRSSRKFWRRRVVSSGALRTWQHWQTRLYPIPVPQYRPLSGCRACCLKLLAFQTNHGATNTNRRISSSIRSPRCTPPPTRGTLAGANTPTSATGTSRGCCSYLKRLLQTPEEAAAYT